MRIIKNIILWIISMFMLLSAITYLPSAASLTLALTGLIILPVGKWQSVLGGVIKKKLKITLAIVLFVISFALVPVDNTESQIYEDINITSTVATIQTAEEITATTEITEIETSPSIQLTETTNTVPIEQNETIIESSTDAPAIYEFDELQTIFLAITPDTCTEEIEKAITEFALCYTCREYNKSGGGKSISYKIAYSDGVAKQSHADYGDYLDIDFDKENGKLMTAEYFNQESFNSALLYCYGVWWDFSNSNAENYSGFYLIDRRSGENGLTIKYTNGNETETHYFPYETSEEVIQHIINFEE